MLRPLCIGFCLVGLTLAPAAPPALGQALAAAGDVCAALARDMEVEEGIPPGLVHALALAESGRWLPELGRSQAWPWTVTSGKDSFYLPSKAAALRKVEELRRSGRWNIDVGCMQINLGYHGDAFTSLAEALEPRANVRYAAQFLKRLRVETRSWARATARYHSNVPDRGRAYRAKVYRLWHRLRRTRLAMAEPDQTPSLLVPHRRTPIEDRRPRLIIPALGAGRPDERAPGAIAILRGRSGS